MSQTLEDQAIDTITRPQQDDVIRFEDSPRRVRVMLAGTVVADSRRMKLMLEQRHLPVYYFPMSDVRMDLLEQTSHHTTCPHKGEASYWTVRAGGRTAENAVWGYPRPLPGREVLKDYVAFYWNRMDHWFEEDDEVFVEPRDPYHRVDVLNSSRHVKVIVGGETVAESGRPRLLFETGLPTRYYIPKLDVRLDLLVKTDTHTGCPYKGTASYWSVNVNGKVFKDVVWAYDHPTLPAALIEGLLCFYNEKVDAIIVDGEEQPKPKTPWS
jgi:uncharacterized protein (DUF427 family)